MTNITQANGKEISGVSQEIQKNYEAFKGKGLKLDLTRGKPAAAQLDLSAELLALPGSGDFVAEGGVDCRNYGGLQGLTEARRLFSGIMGAPLEQVVIANNSSLALMHDTIVYALLATARDLGLRRGLRRALRRGLGRGLRADRKKAGLRFCARCLDTTGTLRSARN